MTALCTLAPSRGTPSPTLRTPASCKRSSPASFAAAALLRSLPSGSQSRLLSALLYIFYRTKEITRDTPRRTHVRGKTREFLLMKKGRRLSAGSGFYGSCLFQHLFFAIYQGIDVVRSQFKPVSMGNRIGRTRFYAIPAKNAARVIDVVHRSVPLSCGDAVRIGVLRRLNIDAIRRAGRRAKETSHALFEPVFVPVQHVNSAIPRLEMHWFVWIVLRDRFPEHVPERHAEPFEHGVERLDHFPKRGCHIRKSIRHLSTPANGR